MSYNYGSDNEEKKERKQKKKKETNHEFRDILFEDGKL